MSKMIHKDPDPRPKPHRKRKSFQMKLKSIFLGKLLTAPWRIIIVMSDGVGKTFLK